jgi:hypothetical protein
MVQIQDGSLVPASQLLSGEGEDPDTESGKLKFEQVKGTVFPTYRAKSKMNDGSGRKRTYTFSLEDTNVVVHVAQTTEEEEEQQNKDKGENKGETGTEKAFHETKVSDTTTTDAKKNSSLSSSSQQNEKLSPPDFKVKKHL